MPWPDAVAHYKDGSAIALSRDTLASDWQTLPVHGLVRIDCDPPFAVAQGGFSLVISGGDAYWGYTEGAQGIVFGVRSYEWNADPIPGDEGSVTPPGSVWDLTRPQYHEWVFDRRAGQPKTERNVTGIPGNALVRYAE